jgi:hypothetical protein
MNTRSQTFYELNAPFTTLDINFDEASAAWKRNKKTLQNATYTYVCMQITKTGNHCSRKPLPNYDYCKTHNKYK